MDKRMTELLELASKVPQVVHSLGIKSVINLTVNDLYGVEVQVLNTNELLNLNWELASYNRIVAEVEGIKFTTCLTEFEKDHLFIQEAIA